MFFYFQSEESEASEDECEERAHVPACPLSPLTPLSPPTPEPSSWIQTGSPLADVFSPSDCFYPLDPRAAAALAAVAANKTDYSALASSGVGTLYTYLFFLGATSRIFRWFCNINNFLVWHI